MFCIRKEDSISITKLTVFIKKKKKNGKSANLVIGLEGKENTLPCWPLCNYNYTNSYCKIKNTCIIHLVHYVAWVE